MEDKKHQLLLYHIWKKDSIRNRERGYASPPESTRLQENKKIEKNFKKVLPFSGKVCYTERGKREKMD